MNEWMNEKENERMDDNDRMDQVKSEQKKYLLTIPYTKRLRWLYEKKTTHFYDFIFIY